MNRALVLSPLVLLGLSSVQAASPEIVPLPTAAGDVVPSRGGVLIIERPLAVERTEEPSPTRILESAQPRLESSPTDAVSASERYGDTLAKGIEAFEGREYATSAEILGSIVEAMAGRGDVGALTMLGYAAMHSARESTAVQAMRKAVDLADDDQRRSALFNVLLGFDRFDEAGAVLDQFKSASERERKRLDLTMARAWAAYDAGLYDHTLALLEPHARRLDEKGRRLIQWATDKMAPLPAPPPAAAEESPIARYDRITGQAVRAFDRAEYPESVRILRSLWDEVQRYGDDGMMLLLGYAAMHTDQEAVAVDAMRKALDLGVDDETRLALVHVLKHFDRLEEAWRVLAKMSPSPERDRQQAELAVALARPPYTAGRYQEAVSVLEPYQADLSPGGLELLGWARYQAGDFETAAHSFETAYTREPSAGSARGLVFSLHRLGAYERLLVLAEAHSGPLDDLIDAEARQSIATGDGRFAVDGDARLSIAASGFAGSPPSLWVRLAPHLREKSGSPGEGRLSQRGITLSGYWQDDGKRLDLEIERQRADDHRHDVVGQRGYGLWRQGLGNGVEYRLGLGRTLSGGAVSPATVGEAGVAFHTASWGTGLRLFRRGNDESLLALTGRHDPGSGVSWGRVLETGVQFEGHVTLRDWDLLGVATTARLSGRQVADNNQLEFYGYALHPVRAGAGLRLGPELYYTEFDNNLSAFEPGHGGYFSPEWFVQVGLLADYEYRDRPGFELDAEAGVGWGWNRQAAADGNPFTGEAPGKYAASQDDDLAYHGKVEMLWGVARNWQVGLFAGGRKSRGYTDWRAGIQLQRRCAK